MQQRPDDPDAILHDKVVRALGFAQFELLRLSTEVEVLQRNLTVAKASVPPADPPSGD